MIDIDLAGELIRVSIDRQKPIVYSDVIQDVGCIELWLIPFGVIQNPTLESHPVWQPNTRMTMVIAPEFRTNNVWGLYGGNVISSQDVAGKLHLFAEMNGYVAKLLTRISKEIEEIPSEIPNAR